jgi:putative cell wall-binding protein
MSLAKNMNAPILLTNLKTLPAETLAEIKRLKAKNVIILGGTGAVGEEVESALKKEGLKTERIAGATRFETATKIAEKMQKLSGKAPEDVFFVYGLNYADALSVSTVAALKNAPIIYLTTKGNLNADTAAYLAKIKGSVKNAYVIGGDGVISNDMMKKAGNALGVTPKRVFGANRFETCVAVNEKFADVLDGDMLCVATGMDFPDALAGGVYAALNKAPLFLINGKAKTPNLNDAQKAYLKGKNAATITTFGGEGVVPDSHIADIAKNSI